jgi:hypothetical protein
MDVICFLFVSLGSSTVQLHDSLSSVAGFGSQHGDRTWGVYYRTVALCAAFWGGAKGLSAKDINKEVFPVYGGKCSSRKAAHNWVEKFSQGRSKVAEVTETTVKRFLCCGVRRAGKVTGQVYHRWWRTCREINVFFQVRISHVLRFYSFVTYFLILAHSKRLFCSEHLTVTFLLMFKCTSAYKL